MTSKKVWNIYTWHTALCVLYGAGISAMYSKDYIVAAGFFFASIVLLASRATSRKSKNADKD